MWLTSSSLSMNSRSSTDRSGGATCFGIAPLTRVLGHSIRTSSRSSLLWRGSRSICGSQIAMSRSHQRMFRHTSPLSFSRSNSLGGLSSLRQMRLRSSQRRPIGTSSHSIVLTSGSSNTSGLQRTKSLRRRQRSKPTRPSSLDTLSPSGGRSIYGRSLRMLPLNQTHQYTSLRSTLASLGKRSTSGLLHQTNRSDVPAYFLAKFSPTVFARRVFPQPTDAPPVVTPETPTYFLARFRPFAWKPQYLWVPTEDFSTPSAAFATNQFFLARYSPLVFKLDLALRQFASVDGLPPAPPVTFPATYYMLEDQWIDNQFYLPAGTIQSTRDLGGVLPLNWVPNPNVDPVDDGAVAAYTAVGYQPRGLSRQQYTTTPVLPPNYVWKQINGLWTLVKVASFPRVL